MLERAHLPADGRQLACLDAADASDGDPLAQQRQPCGGEAVALAQDRGGERLLADFERAEADRLRGDLAAGGLHLLDDPYVLVLDPLRERKALEHVLETGGLEHDAHEVGAV